MTKKEMQGRALSSSPSVVEPVAVVGLSCRFPKAPSAAAFWDLLCAGIDAITEIPKERWDAAKLYSPDQFAPGKTNSKWGGFLEGIDRFDPLFFGISPKEAVQLDPQQRLLLALSWEALEDAGIIPDTLRESRTGVYFGLMWLDYLLLIQAAGLEALTQHTVLGAFHSFAANRVSYSLGLQGPSLVVDSASSSSLVAAHLACESLRCGETTVALAGGISLNLHPSSMLIMSKTGALSPNGRCFTFDARANGYVRGEGGGVVVLKLLSQALADEDRIYCVITGSAVNNDGPSEGIAAPNRRAQEAVLSEAYARAGVLPCEVDYVELHGTGTPLGDPIEAAALASITGPGRPRERPLRVGSVKTNIGHLEPAAGIAGLIKTALSINCRQLPPSLHFQRLNPEIRADLPLQVQQALTPWPSRGLNQSITAGVSSFSLGGTNCHMVLQEAPRQRSDRAKPPCQSAGRRGESAPHSLEALSAAASEARCTEVPYLLPLSARSADSLLDLAREYTRFLAGSPGAQTQDIAYTASARRSHHRHRLAFVGNTKQEWQAALDALLNSELQTPSAFGSAQERPSVVFMFSGQGSQWLGMGRQLLREEPSFRAALEDCDRAIEAEAGWSLLQELTQSEDRSRLGRIEVIQPALVSLQIAMAALWHSWGIIPDAVIGHSMGEVAAAQVSGALSLQQAIRVICRRSQLMQRLSGQGAMAMVELSSAEAHQVIRGAEGRLSIAAVNGPRSTILSGDSSALDAALQQVERQKRFFRKVQVEVASHSPQMEVLRSELLAVLAGVSSHAATVPMHSTVTGKPVEPGSLDAAYWYRNLRDPVLFWPTAERLLDKGPVVFVELSPHPILVPAVQEGLAETQRRGTVLGTLRREQPERRCLLETLGELYVRGQDVAWAQLYPHGGQCISLPSYPWQKERYWITDPPRPADPEVGGEATVPLAPTGPAVDQAVNHFLSLQWRQLERPSGEKATAAARGTWLIFTRDTAAGTALLAALRAAGQSCLQVESGDRYQQLGDCRYQIRPQVPADYLTLLREAGAPAGGCQGVVHLWSLAESAAEGASAASLLDAQTLSCMSALSLVQALLQTGWRKLPRLWLLTAGTQAVVPTDAVDAVAQALLWGLGHAISLQHPELSCTQVDLSAGASPTEYSALVDLLLAPGAEDQLALRGATGYAPRLSRSSPVPQAPPEPLHPEAAYLIQDGLSGPGLTAAEWLVEQGARHLILLTSSAPKEPAGSTLQRLHEAGAQVRLVPTAGAERVALTALLHELRQARRPLRGVVVAAPGLGEPTASGPDAAQFAQALAATLHSAWSLHTLTQDEPLDFFICFSSLKPLFGGTERALGLATSAFFSALAHHRRRRGLPGLNLGWSSFPAHPGAAVAAADPADPDSGALSPKECKQSFLQVLRSSQAHLGVMKLDVRQLLEERPMLAGSRLWLELWRERGQAAPATGLEAARLREALQQLRPGDRRAHLEAHLSKQLGQVLRLDPARIERQTPFKKLGLDSLMSFELRNRLERSTGIRLSAVLLFTYPNLAALTDYLHDAMSLTAPAEQPQPAAKAAAQPGRTADDLDQLSEDELVSRLTKKLFSDKQRPK